MPVRFRLMVGAGHGDPAAHRLVHLPLVLPGRQDPGEYGDDDDQSEEDREGVREAGCEPSRPAILLARLALRSGVGWHDAPPFKPRAIPVRLMARQHDLRRGREAQAVRNLATEGLHLPIEAMPSFLGCGRLPKQVDSVLT